MSLQKDEGQKYEKELGCQRIWNSTAYNDRHCRVREGGFPVVELAGPEHLRIASDQLLASRWTAGIELDPFWGMARRVGLSPTMEHPRHGQRDVSKEIGRAHV